MDDKNMVAKIEECVINKQIKVALHRIEENTDGEKTSSEKMTFDFHFDRPIAISILNDKKEEIYHSDITPEKTENRWDNYVVRIIISGSKTGHKYTVSANSADKAYVKKFGYELSK